jgi:hypothetical protein
MGIRHTKKIAAGNKSGMVAVLPDRKEKGGMKIWNLSLYSVIKFF